MKWHKILFLCVITLSTLPLSAYSDTSSTLPLTLSADQAVKLQHIFPDAVTESDSNNANVLATTEHVVWNKIPINVVLPVNQERMLSFPDSVQFGYNNAVLTDDMLSIQNVNGTVYLIAKKSFTTQRVFVQLKQTGELILLDLSAKLGADNTPLAIVLPDSLAPSSLPISNQTQNSSSSEAVDYTELSRFAIQQLYAPKRLLVNSPNIYRVPMHTTHTIPLIEGDSVIAMPLISWRDGDDFITAVMLRNRLSHLVILDPRRIRGEWKTAAFFPQTRLASVGSTRDSTTVFLISDQPFADGLGD